MAGKKTCRWCGGAFEASSLCLEYCSAECKRQRRNYERRERRLKAKLAPQPQGAAQTEIDRLKADNARLCAEKAELVERLRREVEWSDKVCGERDIARNKASNLMQKVNTLELKIALLQRKNARDKMASATWYLCERMRLKQTSPLPCGTRPDCFRPDRCKHVPKGKSASDVVSPLKAMDGTAPVLPAQTNAYQPKHRIDS